MILTNLMFVIACTFMFGLQKLLYGPLRPIEVEQLYEKAWFAITETCLAMTIFRGEIGAWFLVMFFALLAGKVWQWIGEGRVEILEQQPPRNPRLFHTRLAISLGLSIFFDLTMLEYVVNQVMRMARPDMMVMFGFEFAVLSLLSLSTAARYTIQLVEIGIVRGQKSKRVEEVRKERIEAAKKTLEEAEREEPAAREEGEHPQNGSAQPTTRPSIETAREALRQAEQPVDENEVEVEGWEGKPRWVFYLDLTTDFFKLVLYLSFFIILLVFYGLPIHIMRDVFLTMRSFFKRISDFIKYRTATRDMNARYPDATAEEIGTEGVCIICREEMRPYQAAAEGQQQQPNPVAERSRPKKLPCGHVLHFACLRSWLERQQVCPTCRRPVVSTAPGTNTQGAGGAANVVPGQHPPGERPVARVFQLGPLRIGVGAARGEHMFEELQQQMANNRAPNGQARNLQQYQFGIRWDGGRRRGRHAPGTIRERLDGVEQQLQEEMQALAQSTREYGILRNAQLQLEALRAQQGIATQPAPGAATTTGAPVQTGPSPSAGVFPVSTPIRPAQVLHADPGGQVLQAGSDNLPAGMTLPEGWSMMPLRPTAVPTHPVMPNAALGPQAFPVMPQTLQGQSVGQMPVPDHVRAMFSGMPNQGANVHVHQHQHPYPHPHQHPAQLPSQPQAVPMPNQQHAQQPEANGIPPVPQDVAARHEQFLASLQNPQTTSQVPDPPHPIGADDPLSSQQQLERSTNGASSRAAVQDTTTNGIGEAGSSAQPLPSWGSQATEPNENGAASGARENMETSSSLEPTAGKAKPGSVEDLVEDPD